MVRVEAGGVERVSWEVSLTAESLMPVRGRGRGARRAARKGLSAVEGSEGICGGVQRERQKNGGVLSSSERTRRWDWKGDGVIVGQKGSGVGNRQ